MNSKYDYYIHILLYTMPLSKRVKQTCLIGWGIAMVNALLIILSNAAQVNY